MIELTRNDLDSHDWTARASEALAKAKKLPPGLKRSEAIRKAGQLRIAADMKNWLTAKERTNVEPTSKGIVVRAFTERPRGGAVPVRVRGPKGWLSGPASVGGLFHLNLPNKSFWSPGFHLRCAELSNP
jgi:hypothetical protein